MNPIDIDLTIPVADASLSGILRVPEGSARPAAALLVGGSGPLDRDSNSKRIKIDVMRQVADHLATAGIATLRYDKRGVGDSGGDYLSAGFYDNVEDAWRALQTLRERAEIDSNRIVVVGHSEGALIATELGRDQDLSGIVLLAGAATSGEQVLKWQARQIASTLPAPVRWLMRVLRQDVVKTQAKRLARIQASTADVIRITFIKLNAKWFREFMAHDPAESLQEVEIPVLAITGSKDIQVNPADVESMARLVSSRFDGHVPQNVTHLLRTEPGPATVRKYKKQVRRPVDAGLLEVVADWIGTRDIAGDGGERNIEQLH